MFEECGGLYKFELLAMAPLSDGLNIWTSCPRSKPLRLSVGCVVTIETRVWRHSQTKLCNSRGNPSCGITNQTLSRNHGSQCETVTNYEVDTRIFRVGLDISVGIATRYGLDSPGIESRWGARFSAPVQTVPGVHTPSYRMDTGSFSQGYSGRGMALTTHPI